MSADSRYARQRQVNIISQMGQDALAKSKILVVGAGGLGCHVASQLAGAGIGSITVVDDDVIAKDNLHRQLLYREADIGLAKALIAGRELRALNSEVSINTVAERIAPLNTLRLVQGCDAVVDAADNFTTSYLLSDACTINNIPLVSASVNATFGHIGVFCCSGERPAPTYRAVFPRLSAQAGNCDSVGVTGPSVGIIGSLQAQETIKVLIGGEPQLRGKLLYLDLWNYSQHLVDVSTAEENPDSQIDLLDASQLTGTDFIIDVREQSEITAQAQIFDTHCHIPLARIVDNLDQLPSQGRVVCACQSGQRALLAAQIICDHGYPGAAALLPSRGPSAGA